MLRNGVTLQSFQAQSGAFTQNSCPCYAATGTCYQGVCHYGFDDDGTCDDEDACTENDQCFNGHCQGSPIACVEPWRSAFRVMNSVAEEPPRPGPPLPP